MLRRRCWSRISSQTRSEQTSLSPKTGMGETARAKGWLRNRKSETRKTRFVINQVIGTDPFHDPSLGQQVVLPTQSWSCCRSSLVTLARACPGRQGHHTDSIGPFHGSVATELGVKVRRQVSFRQLSKDQMPDAVLKFGIC